ncbi:bifunctional adenosylcobinamide kinase/adenosylcobinamide-phosphate guanylyltransferase [Sphingomonas xinjiangensis]|uniref:Bifunctional adenosylcobalamin biosynthesis protein n=1 Tax=Sphingomonas xinjiangensis TaxID=643568 RepID=A0A840YQ96_9SPHN|nr:bifunctional adenosylcobinamide kinase/adenosylcobinamide-phosphate guanylyltransferase [Sphingomonas xinjiangensis]MBB5710951.1 adenosylcobinamide kinase/adenosylcobinamide-phosphate guanylyltransferase [Sphingomonas xinjiangensis]
MTARFEQGDRGLLVLGGARSGKSRHAQALAEARGGELVFVATGQAFDDEMRDRIARHQADRDGRWRTVEAPLDLAEAIGDVSGHTVLVDCLTLWTSNLLLDEADWENATARLIEAIQAHHGTLILVANEVGLGIVPDNALARRFRDMAGTINQRVAAAVDRVHFLAAGLPLALK